MADKIPGWRFMMEISQVKENLVFYLAGREYVWRFFSYASGMELLQLSTRVQDKAKLRLCDTYVADLMGKQLAQDIYGSVSLFHTQPLLESSSDMEDIVEFNDYSSD
jgi:hypothetical protein